MEFLSISKVQCMIHDNASCYVEEEEEEDMPTLEQKEEEDVEQVTRDPMEYIDHMFMVCGFVRLFEEDNYTKHNVSRMYSSPTGLCVSIKCGLSYKCSFLYDDKITYIYPATNELLDYVSQGEDIIGLNESYKLIEKSKILPETFEIIVFKKDTKPLSEHTIKAFEDTFLNHKNISVSASGCTIIITYAPVCADENDKRKVSVEDFIKLLSHSW